jgi:hypothetical protein
LGLANDSQAVYILIRFADPQWAQQIRRGGMTIWLDETGGREQRFGLRYNGGPAPSDSNHAFPMNIPPQRAEQMRENLKPRPERLIVVDRRAEQLVPLDSANEYGLAAKYAFADGFYCYEVRIPLQIISADFYGIKTTAGQTIGLGIEWGGMNRFREEFGEKGGNFEGPDIPPGGGQGRRGGPGMPPGRPGMQLPEKQEFWLKLTTADGKESVQKIN